MRNANEQAERKWTGLRQPRAAYPNTPALQQSFHHSRTSLGAAGHWIHLLGVTAPLIIGEIVEDPTKRWRALRASAVATALLSEAVWTYRLSKEREKDEASRAALKECAERVV